MLLAAGLAAGAADADEVAAGLFAVALAVGGSTFVPETFRALLRRRLGVGLAMGAMGSDVAIEAADVALMGEDLTHLPEVLAHARDAARIMRQNLVLSGLIIGILIPLAALGVLGLATVVATHELAEVLVIANGVRAGRRAPRVGGSSVAVTAPVGVRQPFVQRVVDGVDLVEADVVQPGARRAER